MRHTLSSAPFVSLTVFASLLATACGGGGGSAVKAPQFNNLSFLSRFDIPLGSQATAVVTKDLDGDGFLDVVVGQYTDSKVALIRGLGNGAYASASDLPTSPLAAFTLTLGDIDGDQLMDIAVSDLASQQISLYRNIGGAFFSVQTPVPTSQNVLGLEIADIDGDGKADIVAASFDSNEIRVHRGLGGFAFDGGTSFPVAGTPTHVRSALLDGDALPDLVFTDLEGETVYRWKNTSTPGAVSFAPAGSAAAAKPYGLVLANFDADAALEVAVSTVGFPAISVWKQGGAGLTPLSSVALPSPPMGLAVGDVNGDGNLDLVATLAMDDAIAVVPGNGDGTFGAPILRATGRVPIDVSVADGNADGFADIFVTGGDSGQLSVFTGGPVEPSGPPTMHPGFAPYLASYGDLNGDHLPDLLFADAATNQLRIYRNEGSLSFTEAAVLSVPGTPGLPIAVDVDKDGDLDVAQLHTNGLTVFRNDGFFSFTTQPTVSQGVELAYGVAVDLDKDKDFDLVASSPGTSSLRVFRSQNGSLQPWATVPAGAGAAFVVVADVDRDGRLDLVNTNMFADTVSIARRLPTGAWAGNSVVLPTGSLPTFVRVADLDGDKRPELVIAHRASDSLRLYHNDGMLSFTAESISAPGIAQTVFLDDLNVDGKPDLLYTENVTGKATLRLGNGDGTFGPPVASFPTQYVLSTPFLVDLDADGRKELVANSNQTGIVTIHRNLSH
ncbi:MAG TPA: VCBS repeat-containing protein [Planctomycetota bacterium]|nr:VCBS repeat-containing protein [Planctomycetota bacterium]